MGNAESNEVPDDGQSRENSADTTRREPVEESNFWEDFMGFSTAMWPEEYYNMADEMGSVAGRQSSAGTTPGSPAPASMAANIAAKESKVVDSAPTPSAPSSEPSKDADSAEPKAQETTIPNGTTTTTAKDVEADFHISKSQITSPSHPKTELANGSVTSRVSPMHRRRIPIKNGAFVLFLLLHGGVAILLIYLSVLFLKDITPSKRLDLQRWYPQLCLAVFIGALFGMIFQTLFHHRPKLMVRSIVWISSVLTLGVFVMLITTSRPASLGVGAMCLIFSICLALYACWISSRIKYAGRLFDFCLSQTAREIPRIYVSSFWMVLVASVWLFFWSFGIVCAVSQRDAPVIILALLGSVAWTLETLRNVVMATTARRAAALYLDQGDLSVRQTLRAAFFVWLGNIWLGSLIVPTLHILHVMARGVGRIHSQNEFMFSCADCFHSITGKLYKHANNWAYVQVAVWNKNFFRASHDTITLFESKHIDRVIEKDLTSSFCVLTGISGGMICALISGIWTLQYHRDSVTSVAVIAFCIGYFLVRIFMAVPHGIVSAHYVCYAENPMNRRLAGSPVTDRLKELSKLDTEAAAP